MHWTIAASFINKANASMSRWLVPFVPGQRHQFQFVPRRDPLSNLSWHNRASRFTGYREWLGLWHQSQEAWNQSQGGIITIFPQLAATVGIQKLLSRKRTPIIAWSFNLNQCYGGIKGWLARMTLNNIDCFVVHSRQEVKNYSQWLELPPERFEFVPLQRPEIPIVYEEEQKEPFIVAIGSANRDYTTFFKAVENLGIKTVVVAARHSLTGVDIPPQVELLSGINREECYRLMQQARINIVPLLDVPTASGQSTIVETMRMGRAMITSQCVGSEDYVNNGETGILVRPESPHELAQAIAMLWHDERQRNALAEAANHYATDNLSDLAAGANLGRILDSVADKIENN